MPMIVRTPEEIFRTEKKDIYVIHNLEKEGFRNAPGLGMVLKWIEDYLPGTHTELIGPSEYSGVIEGGIDGSFRVDFTPEGLQKFCERWEVNNSSVDSRFQCYIHSYQKWFEDHGQFVPVADKPTELGLAVWVHTPKGFLYHQFSLGQAREKHLRVHPASCRDIWTHAKDIWPDIADLDFHDLASGRTYLDQSGRIERVIYTLPVGGDAEKYQPSTVEQIRQWFAIPVDVELIEDAF